ncbi:MAG: NADPH-dependent FMN reductase [Phycisphaerales bacterium]
MADTIRIGMISGSLRTGSYNRKLVEYVAKNVLDSTDAELVDISLAELDLPMFSEDLEAVEFPASALKLKELMMSCDTILIASPEYNGSLSGALKNAIDWASRPREGEAPLACFKGKTAGLLSASPGAIGGLRGLRHVRQILTQLQMYVSPIEFALGSAHAAFDDHGNITDERAAASAQRVGEDMIQLCRALHK